MTRSPTPGSATSMREANRARIVEAVKRYGGLTQVELAAATGVSTATVSTIVRELLAAGVVETHSTSRSGRRATRVTMARRLGVVAGVQVGPRALRVALSDLALDVVADQFLPLPPDHRVDTTLDRAALLVMDLLDQVGADVEELLALGLALPAPVAPDTGELTVRGAMRGWEDTELARVLSRRISRPVHADKDAALGAIAEHDLGAARGLHDVVYVRVGHTTTAGLLLDGRVHRGRAGTAGEIGHVQVDPSGPVCRCGSRGCLDTVVSAPALLSLLRASHGDLTVHDLLAQAAGGDPGCRRVLADAGRAVGQVVGDLVTALGPESVVVGGELAAAGEVLLDPLREAVAARAVPSTRGAVPVVGGELGDRADILGALALARRKTQIELAMRGGTTT
ncbi:ROK family transcriptional regulator [Myceligenerans xiligouense]|uniref:MarR family transcriptional regulator n=1 Tax=Myceligenerans xiligouense TaxID=253184 RepID=A0A3N4YRG0_9MICO|nr:ROK family transcriptional regulator [Myceligenerans xiligouense]RPF22727.1 MarR family transcriptional regulator [Myceligenerans xiligouense]